MTFKDWLPIPFVFAAGVAVGVFVLGVDAGRGWAALVGLIAGSAMTVWMVRDRTPSDSGEPGKHER